MKLQPVSLFCVFVCVYERERARGWVRELHVLVLSLLLFLYPIPPSLSVPFYLSHHSIPQAPILFHRCHSQEPAQIRNTDLKKVGFVDFGKEKENIPLLLNLPSSKTTPWLYLGCVWWREQERVEEEIEKKGKQTTCNTGQRGQPAFLWTLHEGLTS